MSAIETQPCMYLRDPELGSVEVADPAQSTQDWLVEAEFNYRLMNDLRLVPPLVLRMQEDLRFMLGLDDADSTRLGIALEEALINAICHGNLEVSSDLRNDQSECSYLEMIERRQKESPFRDRVVHVRSRANRNEAVCTIRDEGPGFDVGALPDPTAPANLEKPSGRGLLLIRRFMDEVRHNALGNEITMVKRRRNAGRAHTPVSEEHGS